MNQNAVNKQKCLFLSARRYSINSSVIRGFESNNFEIRVIDYEDFFNRSVNRFVRKYESLPNRIKNLWKNKYIERINKRYLKEFSDYCPDIVFIYNNQNIFPETIKHFRKSAKVAFLLGDNPLYTPTNKYNLHILFSADYIISPDSFWCEQLHKMGINNVYFDCFSFDTEVYYPFEVEKDLLEKHRSDLVYVGAAHKNNWGYKRFLFLDQFKKFNLKVYISGGGYTKIWGAFFPILKEKIIAHNRYDHQFNNTVYNCSKISPVELVPSLFNGVHVRVFDILGSGIFPLCEYSPDLERVFTGIDVPFIRSFNEAENIADHLLQNDTLRKALIAKMRDVIIEKYSPGIVIRRMLEKIID